jgi:hypothetical protein
MRERSLPKVDYTRLPESGVVGALIDGAGRHANPEYDGRSLLHGCGLETGAPA